MKKTFRSYLVTGGCGFVASCVVTRLLEEPGAQVIIFDNLFNGRREFLPPSRRVAFHQLDLTDAEAVRGAVREARPEVVIHLAALHFIPYCNAHPEQTLEVNVVGTQNLLEALRAHAPARVVAASSMAVYPIKDGPNREDDPVGPTDIYGLSKWVNEQQLDLFARQTGIPCAAARLSNVYGPNETNPHVVPEIFEQVARGRTELALGNVKPKRDYVYVSDVARALVAIAHRSQSPYRVYNVGTGAEYSVEEIVERLARISGRELTIQMAADRVRKADRMHLLADPCRLIQETGWRPEYDLERGLTELWQWYAARVSPRAYAAAAG